MAAAAEPPTGTRRERGRQTERKQEEREGGEGKGRGSPFLSYPLLSMLAVEWEPKRLMLWVGLGLGVKRERERSSTERNVLSSLAVQTVFKDKHIERITYDYSL